MRYTSHLVEAASRFAAEPTDENFKKLLSAVTGELAVRAGVSAVAKLVLGDRKDGRKRR